MLFNFFHFPFSSNSVWRKRLSSLNTSVSTIFPSFLLFSMFRFSSFLKIINSVLNSSPPKRRRKINQDLLLHILPIQPFLHSSFFLSNVKHKKKNYPLSILLNLLNGSFSAPFSWRSKAMQNGSLLSSVPCVHHSHSSFPGPADEKREQARHSGNLGQCPASVASGAEQGADGVAALGDGGGGRRRGTGWHSTPHSGPPFLPSSLPPSVLTFPPPPFL